AFVPAKNGHRNPKLGQCREHLNTIGRGPIGVNESQCSFYSKLPMPSKKSIGRAFRLARRAAGMSQDDFTAVSSRTYVSSIERGLKSLTIEKLSQLALAM